MVTQTQPPEPPKAGKGLRLALAVSVALNLATLGIVAGAILRDGPDMRGGMVRELGFGPYSEALSPEDRKALRQALFERAPEIRDTRRLMRQDSQTLLALLRAETFDAAAFHDRMEAQHARMEKQLRLGLDLLQDFIAAMPPEDRRAFADRLETVLRRGGKEHGPDGGPEGAPAPQDAD